MKGGKTKWVRLSVTRFHSLRQMSANASAPNALSSPKASVWVASSQPSKRLCRKALLSERTFRDSIVQRARQRARTSILNKPVSVVPVLSLKSTTSQREHPLDTIAETDSQNDKVGLSIFGKRQRICHSYIMEPRISALRVRKRIPVPEAYVFAVPSRKRFLRQRLRQVPAGVRLEWLLNVQEVAVLPTDTTVQQWSPDTKSPTQDGSYTTSDEDHLFLMGCELPYQGLYFCWDCRKTLKQVFSDTQVVDFTTREFSKITTFGLFRQSRYLSSVSDTSKKVTIWFSYIHMGYVISSGNPQPKMLSLSDDL